MADTDLKSRAAVALEDSLEAPRKDMNAGRTTVRVDNCGLGFHLDEIAADSLSDGVHSILTPTTLSIVQNLENGRQNGKHYG